MISVVIPTYKNKEQFLKNLTHNLTYLTGCEIIIGNDNPDQSLKKLLKDFKQITLFENKENRGFARTVDRGIKKAKNSLVMLLNSDAILKDDSFKKALSAFKKNPYLLAVAFAQEERDFAVVGKNRIFWRNGMFYHDRSNNLKPGLNARAEGGACILNKDIYLKLGGFDFLYSPFYWEDIDLSYRAWKSGYKINFDPKIKVEHHHESTIGKYFTKTFTKGIAYRNQFIFIWKNITDISLIISHLLLLKLNLFYLLLKGESEVWTGLISAIKIYPEIIKQRKLVKKIFSLKDKDILDIFKEKE